MKSTNDATHDSARDDDDTIRRLLLAALDEEATAAQLDQLNGLLEQSKEARRVAARFLTDEAVLSEEIGTLDSALAYLQQAGHGAALRTLARPWPQRAWESVRRAAAAVNEHGLAVAVLVAVVGAVWAWDHFSLLSRLDQLYQLALMEGPGPSSARGGDHGRSAPRPVPIARVTGVQDCVWPKGQSPLFFGDALVAGKRLRLEKGVLQLTYETGAKMVVEGPADMVMTTGMEAELTSGKIAAAVPRFARGYTIFTPTAEVVDLGTEFGVSVDDDGLSEIHVFDGDVVTRLKGEHGTGELLHARQAEAVAFGTAKAPPQRISFNGKKFVRRLIPDLPADRLPPLPVTENLALWLAADVMPVVAEGDFVSAWPDILIGDNQFPDDAWQFDARRCPAWGRDAAGRPSVRFDGWSTYLATSPREIGDSQTVFVVFAPGPTSFASARQGGIMFKDGIEAPTLELAMLSDRRPRGLVYAADEAGKASDVAVLEGAPIKALVPSVASYEYDAVANRAELVVNGVSQGTSDAPRPVGQQARTYIGSHAQQWVDAYFLGSIYEIVVYNKALDADARELVFDYLSDRYDVTLGK